jgi:PTH1 family peptidyl-tRNA hydrolase
MSDLWMVVGLGNPGKRYQGNRHNVGFMTVDALAAAGSFEWRTSQRFEAEYAKGMLGGLAVLLAKPQTYMNLSGQSVAQLARFYEVPVDRIVVVHDDVDLELARLRVRAGGRDGGHKGIRSMMELLGSASFVRVRFGVGRPAVGDVTDYVLHDFPAAEAELVEDGVRRAVDAVETVVTRGLEEAMNKHNGPREPRKKKEDKQADEDEKPDEADGAP